MNSRKGYVVTREREIARSFSQPKLYVSYNFPESPAHLLLKPSSTDISIGRQGTARHQELQSLRTRCRVALNESDALNEVNCILKSHSSVLKEISWLPLPMLSQVH